MNKTHGPLILKDLDPLWKLVPNYTQNSWSHYMYKNFDIFLICNN